MPARIVSTLLVALALAIASPRPGAAASGISLSDPVSYENLSVYFVRGPSSNAPAPLTLQEASAKGLVRIREMSTGSPMLDNLSDKPVFVPFGTMLTGQARPALRFRCSASSADARSKGKETTRLHSP